MIQTFHKLKIVKSLILLIRKMYVVKGILKIFNGRIRRGGVKGRFLILGADSGHIARTVYRRLATKSLTRRFYKI